MKGLNAYARLNLIGKLFLPIAIIIFFNIFLKFISSAEKGVLLIILIISGVLVFLSVLYVILYPQFMSQDLMILAYDEYLYDLIKSYEGLVKSREEKIEALKDTDTRKFIIGKKHHRRWDLVREKKLLADASVNKDNIIQEHLKGLAKVQEQLDYYLSEHKACAKFLEKFHKTSQQAV